MSWETRIPQRTEGGRAIGEPWRRVAPGTSGPESLRLLWFNLATDADDPVLGFATAWLAAVAERVAAVDVITMREGAHALPPNVRVRSVGKERGWSEARRTLELIRLVEDALRRRPHACFCHMIPVFTVIASPQLRARRVPIVTWYAHAKVTPLLRAAHHLSARMVSSVDAAYRYRRDRLHILGQGIDTRIFAPDPHDTGAPGSPLRLVSVGRLSPVKNVATLVGGLHELRRRGHDACLDLVGDSPPGQGAYAGALRDDVRRRGLADVVHFRGPRPYAGVAAAHRAGAVHVNAGPTGNALDKAVLEAMACGRPSVTSIAAFAETMGDDAPRLLFRAGDPGDLADRLEGLIDAGEDGRAHLGARLRARVERLHGLERLAGRIVEQMEAVRRPLGT